jgi:hypothetical protein
MSGPEEAALRQLLQYSATKEAATLQFLQTATSVSGTQITTGSILLSWIRK